MECIIWVLLISWFKKYNCCLSLIITACLNCLSLRYGDPTHYLTQALSFSHSSITSNVTCLLLKVIWSTYSLQLDFTAVVIPLESHQPPPCSRGTSMNTWSKYHSHLCTHAFFGRVSTIEIPQAKLQEFILQRPMGNLGDQKTVILNERYLKPKSFPKLLCQIPSRNVNMGVPLQFWVGEGRKTWPG